MSANNDMIDISNSSGRVIVVRMKGNPCALDDYIRKNN
jgi:hypothetical protein